MLDEVKAAIEKGNNFLVNQTSVVRPAWGPEPEQDLDPWPTAQILYSLPKLRHAGVILRGLSWLSDQQNPNGSWTSGNYGKSPDTSATACCTVALLHHLGPTSIPAQRGLQWLSENYHNGWANQPASNQSIHYYDTAYALRALARTPRRTVDGSPISEGRRLPALRVREGMALLLGNRHRGEGWGFQPSVPSDPSFTSYVLHGLLDIHHFSRIELPEADLAEALNWLAHKQRHDGPWSDWQGIEASPEGTAYVVYILLSFGIRPDHPRILKAINWLLACQAPEGWWGLYGRDTDSPINWLTNIVLNGLNAFLSADRSGAVETGAATGVFDFRSPLKIAYLDGGAEPMPSFALEFPPPNPPSRRAPLSGQGVDMLYAPLSRLSMNFNQIPYTRELDHTMYKALDKYVAQKLPEKEIERALTSGESIEIHAVYPEHFLQVASLLGYSDVQNVPFEHKKPQGKFNVIRPKFFRAMHTSGQRVLIVAVIPGRDYLMHYASLVRHLVEQRFTAKAAGRIHILYYPLAEESLAAWTGLNQSLVHARDRVLLGYISAIQKHIHQNQRFSAIEEQDTEFYTSYRYTLPDASVLNLLGVKYCFWGSISETLARALCDLGASEILYAAKLGALTGSQDLYRKIFVPSRFYILYHDRIVYEAEAVPNGVLRRFPGLDTGVHISVPTVLEEDYQQRKLATELGAQSIDNEIAQMARAVSFFNRYNEDAPDVLFSAVHFATDYVRAVEDRGEITLFDLSKMRDLATVSTKHEIFGRIYREVLLPYLTGPAEEAPKPLVATTSSVARAAPGTGADTLRIGVIGGGSHATDNLLPALSLLSGVRITSLSSRSLERLEELSARYRVSHKTQDWRELVDANVVDAVVVSATPSIHREVMAYALLHGIHTFVEKPPAEDLSALASLIPIAQAHDKVRTFVDFNFRFGAGFKMLQRELSEAGRVETVNIRFLTAKPREKMWGFPSVLRSYLFAVGIHAIEMAVHVLGDVATVSSRVRRVGESRLVIGGLLTAADGRLAVLDMGNYSNRFVTRVELVTESGMVGLLKDLRNIKMYQGLSPEKQRGRFEGKEILEYTIPSLRGGFAIGGYEAALASFRDSISSGNASASGIERSKLVYEVVNEILRQAGEEGIC